MVRFVASRRRGALRAMSACAKSGDGPCNDRSIRLRNDKSDHMTLPLLGPMTLSGFEHPWFFLFLSSSLGLVGLYIVVQLARQRRMLRFANMELLESVAPQAAHALAAPARDPAGAVAGAVHRRDGRTDERRPDPAQPRGRDAGDRRVAVDACHRRRAQPAGGGAGGGQAVRRRADARHQPRPDRLRGHRHRAGVADHQPRRDQDTRSTSCNWPTAPRPARASSPRCRPSPPSAR